MPGSGRRERMRARDGWELLAQLTVSPTNLWYLLALAAYLGVARLTRNLPSAVVLPVALAVPAVAAAGVLPDLGNLWQVLQNLFFFFLAGLRGRSVVEAVAVRATPVRLLIAGAAYALALAVVGALGMRQWPGVWPTLSALAVAFGVVACALLARGAPALARLLRWIGRRTLPIYVIHMIPLALVDAVLRGASWVTSPVSEAIGPLVLTAVVVGASLGLHALLVRLRLGVLFDPLSVPGRVALVWRWTREPG